MPIHGIFYARFLPQEGTKIVAQSPPGCIVPVAVADESDHEDFDPGHWGADEGGLQHGQDEHVVGGDAVDSDSDSDGDALDIKATRNKRTRKVYKPASDVAPSDSDSGADSDAQSDRSSSSSATKRSRAAAASASALLGTAASTSSSSVFRRAQLGKPLFDFDVMSEYVIPRPAFFNCYLASRDPSGKYAVLGLPVAIRDSKYDRNEFIFNFGIVVDAATDDQGPYERVVRRLATTFAEMEKQNEFLSREEQRAQREKAPPGGGGIGEVLAAGGVTTGAGSGAATHAESTPIDSPLPHAMASAMGNTAAMNSIGGLLDRRRIVSHSPTLGAQGQSQQGSGNNSRTASIGNAGGATSSGPFSQQNYGFTTASAAVTITDHNGHSPYHRRSIQSLLEIIKEDLNLYGECMIPVDDANTINMKLFPIHPNPPAVEGWHVPVPKMRLSDTVDPSWDLTLQRVIAHMDGVSDVRRIAFEADISMELCRSALRHLLYYDTILLLDIFFFGSCYAPRPGIHDFVANVGGIVDECARYVCLGRQDEDASGADGTKTPPTFKAGSKSPKKKATTRARRKSKSKGSKRESKMKGSRAASHASDEEDDNDTEVDNRDDDDDDDAMTVAFPTRRRRRTAGRRGSATSTSSG
ncbi:tumor suppressor candidate 4 [Ophiostoma piceae UAMH 11346]|uniref:Tumor suppressor candidate 4 n=1 Tax=Ophiostoma piceae (strain UAMH 11346) TaxID=1262450 RepID=S3CZ72_OPHP1|nr:tumor suppressor candidate 4 [Ophiostoma piceae UAMH 11346]